MLQKFPAEEFTATAKLKVSAKADGQQSGLIVMGWDYGYLGVVKEGDKFILNQVVCKDAEQRSPETVTHLAELPVSRRFGAGLYSNYERDIYLQVKVTGEVSVISATVWTAGNIHWPVCLLLLVKVSG